MQFVYNFNSDRSFQISLSCVVPIDILIIPVVTCSLSVQSFPNCAPLDTPSLRVKYRRGYSVDDANGPKSSSSSVGSARCWWWRWHYRPSSGEISERTNYERHARGQTIHERFFTVPPLDVVTLRRVDEGRGMGSIWRAFERPYSVVLLLLLMMGWEWSMWWTLDGRGTSYGIIIVAAAKRRRISRIDNGRYSIV